MFNFQQHGENMISTKKGGKLPEGELLHNDIKVDPETGEITRVTTYDAAVAMMEADAVRMFGRNGFAKNRGHRVIGEIPLPEYLELCRIAQENGEDLQGKDLRKYLQENREFMTVPRLNTGHKGQIIIK